MESLTDSFYCRGVSSALAAVLRGGTFNKAATRTREKSRPRPLFVFTNHSSLRNERPPIKYQVFDSRAFAYSRWRRIIDPRAWSGRLLSNRERERAIGETVKLYNKIGNPLIHRGIRGTVLETICAGQASHEERKGSVEGYIIISSIGLIGHGDGKRGRVR